MCPRELQVCVVAVRHFCDLWPAGTTRESPWRGLTFVVARHVCHFKLKIITWSAAWSPPVCPATVEAKIVLLWRRYCRATTSRMRTRSTACATHLYWSTWTMTWVLELQILAGVYIRYTFYLADSICLLASVWSGAEVWYDSWTPAILKSCSILFKAKFVCYDRLVFIHGLLDWASMSELILNCIFWGKKHLQKPFSDAVNITGGGGKWSIQCALQFNSSSCTAF